MSTLHALKTTALDKGFRVEHSEEHDGWVILVPRKPRLPAHVQGSFKTADRAWMAAASLASEWPAL